MFDVFRRVLQVTRPPLLGKVDGDFIEIGLQENFTIKASVQGARAEFLQTLPEGYRTSGIRILYTDTELKTAEVDTRNPDIVVIDGEEFLVKEVTRNNNIPTSIVNHYKILVVKKNIDDNTVRSYEPKNKIRYDR